MQGLIYSFSINPFSTTRRCKRHQNKVKVKGLGRKSSDLAEFSIFFMVLGKSSICWLIKNLKIFSLA